MSERVEATVITDAEISAMPVAGVPTVGGAGRTAIRAIVSPGAIG